MKTLLLTMASVVMLTAQTPPTGKVGIVEGTVVREGTSEPIAEVRITIGGNGILPPAQIAERLLDAEARGQHVSADALDAARASVKAGARPDSAAVTAVTDAAGHFIIKDVPVGNAQVFAQLEGYFAPQINGESSNRAKATVVVNAGETAAVKLTMVPAGTISGRVFDPSGKPLFNGAIQLLRLEYMNGTPAFVVIGAKPTDDRGDYRFYPLPPDEYYLAASPSIPGAPRGTPSVDREVAITTLFPNADNANAATRVVISGGTEMTGVDVRLRTAVASTISVKVTSNYALTGITTAHGVARIGNAVLSLIRHEGDAFSDLLGGTSGTAAADGSFQFTGVTPGIYDIYARLPISDGWGPQNSPGRAASPWGFGHTTLEVSGADVKDVPIVVHQGRDIKGRVAVDGIAGIPQAANVRLTIVAEGEIGRVSDGPTANTYAEVSRFAPPIAPDGSFTIPLVPEGHYRFAVRGMESLSNAYLADIRQGPVSVYDNGIPIGDRPVDPVEVVINTNGGSVEATVIGANQKPASGMTVVLVPTQRRQNPALYKIGRSDDQGHVLLTNLPPGLYKLFAWDRVPFGAWMNTDYIGKVEERGTPVVISSGVRVNVQAKTIVP